MKCLAIGAPFGALYPVSAPKHQQHFQIHLPTIPSMMDHHPCMKRQHSPLPPSPERLPLTILENLVRRAYILLESRANLF